MTFVADYYGVYVERPSRGPMYFIGAIIGRLFWGSGGGQSWWPIIMWFMPNGQVEGPCISLRRLLVDYFGDREGGKAGGRSFWGLTAKLGADVFHWGDYWSII
jgi:hypothetical protein